jgi:carboxyl-terminal processing protease
VVRPRVAALAAPILVVLAAEGRAETPEISPAQWKTLTKAVRIVKREHVAPVDDARLARACAERVYGLPALAAARPGPTVAELAHVPVALRAAAAGAPEGVQPQVIAECLAGMLGSLDAHSRYVPAAEGRDLLLDGPAAVGMELALRAAAVVVLDVFDGSPAAGAGIRPGDRLAAIDGRSVDGLALAEVARRLRGRPGSAVAVTVARGAEVLEFVMARAVVRAPTVRARVIAPAILYLRLWRFEERTLGDVDAAIAPLLDTIETTPRALLLDLRDNGGGLLRTTVDLAAGLLPPGAAVGSTEGRAAGARRRFAGERAWAREGVAAWLRTVPAAVLVNAGTSSGAEMVAGALQAHGRAMLVGTSTAGVGSIQTLVPLDDGAYLRLTTARWLTPRGETLDGHPLTPDVTLVTARGSAPPPPGAARDVELDEAVEILKTRRTAPR